MAHRRWYDRAMNRLWNWVITSAERHPTMFVMVGGIICYFTGFTIFVSSVLAGGFPRETQSTEIWLGITLGSFIIVMFHWFVARYERKSIFAQILALVPATFLFVFVVIGAGLIGVMYQSCTVDSVTGEIRACQEGWQFVWDRD